MENLKECLELLDGLEDVLIWESDADAKFTYVNQSVKTIIGYPPERWIGGPDVWTSLLHPDDQKWVKQLCVEETKKRRSYHCEFRFITADGRTLWVRKHAYLKMNPDGSPDGMRGTMIDITEEKQMAERLVQNETRYRIAMRSTRSMIWDWDLATNELISTEAISDLFAFPAERMKSDVYFWYDNIHPDDRERVIMGVHTAVDGKAQFWEEEYRLRTGAGAYVNVFSRGEIIRDEQGQPHRIIGATSDISQRKKMELERYTLQKEERQALARAEHALKSQDEVVSVLSHDLRNPLSSILMNVLLARRTLISGAPPKHLTQNIERIYEAALRMKTLITDLVDLAHAEAGRLKIEADAIPLGDLIQAALAHVEDFSKQSPRATIEPEFTNHGLFVLADRERIQQAIAKILRYFASQGPEGTTIFLRAGALEDQMIFRIIHPKLFLDRDQLNHLFERKGSAMDLAIVRGVIQAHGGRIWADSGPTTGTSIYFTLNTALPLSYGKTG